MMAAEPNNVIDLSADATAPPDEEEVVFIGSTSAQNKGLKKSHGRPTTNEQHWEVEVLARTINQSTLREEDGEEVVFLGFESKKITAIGESDVEVIPFLLPRLNGKIPAISAFQTDFEMASDLAAEDNCSQQLPKRKRSIRYFNCGVCLEEHIEYFKGYCLETCHHRFCNKCLARLVESSTSIGGSASASIKIDCPEVGCTAALTKNDVSYIFRHDPAGWTAYSNTASLALLEGELTSGKGTTRRCPAERCNFTFCFEPAPTVESEGTRFLCPKCKSMFCLQCKANGGKVGPAHPDMICTERIQQLQKQAEEREKLNVWKQDNAKADARFQELVQRESKQGRTKPCPRCKSLITKDGGCDHMHCRQCGSDFNWSAA
jgi:hypothetical protein